MARWGYCFLHGDASCLGTTWGQPCRLLDATGSSQICGVINSRVSPWSAEYPWFSIRFMLDSVILMEKYGSMYGYVCQIYKKYVWYKNILLYLFLKLFLYAWLVILKSCEQEIKASMRGFSNLLSLYETYFTKHIEIILEWCRIYNFFMKNRNSIHIL